MVEHVRDADMFSNKSHIIKHWMLSHKDLDQRPPFAFKVITQYKDCLSRQIGEAIKIQRTTDNILNSKCEYLSNCLTRLTVLEDDWERRRREKDEEIAENEEKAELERFRNLKMSDKNQGKDEKDSSCEEDYHPYADELKITEEEMLKLDPNMFEKPPPIRVRDEPSLGNATKRRRVTEEDSSQQEEWQHQHAEHPIQEEVGEDVSNHVEEQHPHAENPTALESHDEVPILMENPGLGTSINRKERGRVMITIQMKKQFQLAGTRTRVERKLRRKKSTGMNIAWWTKWWDRMVAEALSSAKLDRQKKITSFMSVSSNQDLQANTPTENIHACEPKLSINEQHPVMCVLGNEIPTAFVNGAKYVRGSKRGLENGSESPAKRNFSVT